VHQSKTISNGTSNQKTVAGVYEKIIKTKLTKTLIMAETSVDKNIGPFTNYLLLDNTIYFSSLHSILILKV